MEPFWHKPALAMSVEVALAERSSDPQLVDELGAERESARQHVYLVTISRAFADTQVAGGFRNVNDVTREFVSTAVRDALNNPMVESAHPGRPRQNTEVVSKIHLCP